MNNKNNLEKLTLEKCFEIVKKNEHFSYKEEIINNQKTFTFFYRHPSIKDFIQPIKDDNIEAFELRGLTFVEQDNDTFKRYLLLNKFFNLNENDGLNGKYSNMITVIKKFDIIRVQDKLDGSLIHFIPFNDKFFAKTKISFYSEQSQIAQNIFDKNSNIQNFIKELTDKDLMPIWEITSPKNQIVIKYDDTILSLLQIRDENTGEYLNIYKNELVSKYNIKIVEEKEVKTLDYYLEERKTIKGIEGWVLTLSNNQMIKIKTEEYFKLHHILSPDVIKENDVIKLVLDDSIDDVISMINEQEETSYNTNEVLKEKREWIENIKNIVSTYIDKKSFELYSIILDSDFNEKIDFVNEYKNTEFFSILSKLYNSNSLEKSEELLKIYIKRNFTDYEKSLKWLDSIHNKDEK